MKLFPFILVVSVLLSCGTSKNKATGKNQVGKTEPVSITATLGRTKVDSDPFTIEKSSISGNILTLEVSYSGGCAQHEFKMEGNEFISKSLPPIRSIRLIHHANGDACEARINQVLKINITELAYKKESGSEIMLKLEGVEESIKYTFE